MIVNTYSGLNEHRTKVYKDGHTLLTSIGPRNTKMNTFQFSQLPTPHLIGTRTFATQSKKLPFEVDTNVVQDVVLFKYENPRFFKMIILFGISQFVFWMYLAHFAYTCLRDITQSEARKLGLPVEVDQDDGNPDKPWWRKINLGENKYRNGITILCTVVGNVILLSSWFYSTRSVRTLVLLKGGKRFRLVTYSPTPFGRRMQVALDNVSCNTSRSHAKVSLPIKLRGYWLHFILDKRGEFTNTKLFDFTAGLKRTWKK